MVNGSNYKGLTPQSGYGTSFRSASDRPGWPKKPDAHLGRPPSAIRSSTNSLATIGMKALSKTNIMQGHNDHGNKSMIAGDNISVYSNNLKERLKEAGHPLRGPIMIQMTLHYLFFLLVLFTANQTYWAPAIRPFMGFGYAVFAFFTLQISRMAYAQSPNSILPFYLSIAPFFFLIFISREAHMVVMVLWYVSFLVIYLQSGHEDLQKHLIIYSVVLLLMYGLCVAGMSQFYVANCTSFFCGVQLKERINAYYEGVLGVACLFVVLCFISLEKFIKLNASTLLERELYMNQLYVANMDLKRQLRRARNDEEVDLEAPLARATQILKEVKDTQDVDRSIADEIDFIINILSSDQLYNPNIYQKPADADVHDWLNDMLLTAANRPNQDGKSKASSVHSHPSFTISGIAEAGHEPKHHTKEVTFSPTVDQGLGALDTKIFALLADIENPNFDVADVDKLSPNRALYYIGWHVFRIHDFFEKFRIPEGRFRHWLTRVESGYKPTNPYHNALHAADVTHSMHYYVTRKRLWSYLTPEEQLSALIAPIIHDYMHPGVNNAFLISTMSALSIRYNDQSVLENFHCASIFELMQAEEYDILAFQSVDARKLIRDSVVSMVLATDMAMHFDWIGKFKNKLNGVGFNFDARQDRKLILNIAIKCADVNNPAKPLDSCKRWTELIMEEFFRQGDEEKRRGVPVSMFYNRETTDIPKCQIGFIDFIVHPLFEAWSGFMLEDLKPQMENITANKAYWKTASMQHSEASSSAATTTNTADKPTNNQPAAASSSSPPPPPPPAAVLRSTSEVNEMPSEESAGSLPQSVPDDK
ncbi:High affinity cAMP-specific 3',5'-cyclic phosphodiesterase 7A [Chytridiales sp. JEL 0842]|nr:High affinity cAMP-specific 3',5'-cyclic phosphodiesterase 7A [Chytridiales sp. JEL 0842]